MSDLQPSPDAPHGFPFEEKNARFYFGFTKDAMRAYRQKNFTGGLDFILHNKRLFISPAGIKKMREATGQRDKKKTSGSQSTDDSASIKKTAPPKPVTLLVVKPSRNKRIIHAVLAGEDPPQLRRLRVNGKMAERFVRGMKVSALLVDGYTDLYDIVGHYPRKKGVW